MAGRARLIDIQRLRTWAQRHTTTEEEGTARTELSLGSEVVGFFSFLPLLWYQSIHLPRDCAAVKLNAAPCWPTPATGTGFPSEHYSTLGGWTANSQGKHRMFNVLPLVFPVYGLQMEALWVRLCCSFVSTFSYKADIMFYSQYSWADTYYCPPKTH